MGTLSYNIAIAGLMPSDIAFRHLHLDSVLGIEAHGLGHLPDVTRMAEVK